MSFLKTMSNFSLEYLRIMTKIAKISIQQLYWPDHKKQTSIIIDSVMNKYWY